MQMTASIEGPLMSVGHLVEAEELIMVQQGGATRSAQMVPVDRPSGQNDVGIVAWLLTLKTPECPQGRQASCCLLAFFHSSSLTPEILSYGLSTLR